MPDSPIPHTLLYSISCCTRATSSVPSQPHLGRVVDGHVLRGVVTDVVQESFLPDLGQLVILVLDVVIDGEGDDESCGILVVVSAI